MSCFHPPKEAVTFGPNIDPRTIKNIAKETGLNYDYSYHGYNKIRIGDLIYHNLQFYTVRRREKWILVVTLVKYAEKKWFISSTHDTIRISNRDLVLFRQCFYPQTFYQYENWITKTLYGINEIPPTREKIKFIIDTGNKDVYTTKIIYTRYYNLRAMYRGSTNEWTRKDLAERFVVIYDYAYVNYLNNKHQWEEKTV